MSKISQLLFLTPLILTFLGCDLKVKKAPDNLDGTVGQVIDGGRSLNADEREMSLKFCQALKDKDLNVNEVLTQKELKYTQSFSDCNGKTNKNVLLVSVMSSLKIEAEGDTYEGFPTTEINHKSEEFNRVCSKILENKDANISNTDTISKNEILRREFSKTGTGIIGSVKKATSVNNGKFQITEVKNYAVDTEGVSGVKGLVTQFQIVKSCGSNSKVSNSLYALTFVSIR